MREDEEAIMKKTFSPLLKIPFFLIGFYCLFCGIYGVVFPSPLPSHHPLIGKRNAFAIRVDKLLAEAPRLAAETNLQKEEVERVILAHVHLCVSRGRVVYPQEVKEALQQLTR